MDEEKLLQNVKITNDSVIFKKDFYENVVMKSMNNASNMKKDIYALYQKINKAIEFINFIKKDNLYELDENIIIMQVSRINELLDILQGDEEN